MFTRVRRLVSQFLNKTRTINNEPLNKVSLIVIVLIDIFILINVFTGLDDISRWHISPTETYPCYADWQQYQTQTTKDKDYNIVRQSLPYDAIAQTGLEQTYRQVEAGHLGTVSATCLQYAKYADAISNSKNRQVVTTINQKQAEVDRLEQSNRAIRVQYDSTLLEKIAGQPREQSINSVGAERAKQQLDQNDRKISALKADVSNLKSELIKQPESVSFLGFIRNSQTYAEVERGYRQASFWYPAIQLFFQSLFLLPLILIAATVHNFAQRRGYGLVALISWHLLVIFLIPLILKVFEFLQVDVVFQFIFNIISALFGGLLFLINYVYILLIPIVGFGIIKFFQRVIFNAKVQASGRVQKSRCVKCARRIRQSDAHCPHCSYEQYIECQNCHNPTYRHLPYCKQCGDSQDLSQFN